MREGAGPLFGLGDADQVEQLGGPSPGGLLADVVVMHPNGLGDLIADGVHRRQRRHRVLEYGADAHTADARHLGISHAEQFLPVEQDRTRNLGVLRQQPDHGHGRRRFTRSRLADHRHHLARRDVIAQSAHGMQVAAVGREGDR